MTGDERIETGNRLLGEIYFEDTDFDYVLPPNEQDDQDSFEGGDIETPAMADLYSEEYCEEEYRLYLAWSCEDQNGHSEDYDSETYDYP